MAITESDLNVDHPAPDPVPESDIWQNIVRPLIPNAPYLELEEPVDGAEPKWRVPANVENAAQWQTLFDKLSWRKL